MRHFPLRPLALPFFAALALLAGGALTAQTEVGNRVLLPPARVEAAAGEDMGLASLVGAHLVEVLASELQRAGFQALKTTDGPYTAEEARRTGYAWLADSELQLRGGIATISIRILDTGGRMVVAAEEFAAWAGPTLVSLVDAAVRRASGAASAARDRLAEASSAPLREPSAFLSPDEGALIEILGLKTEDGRPYSARVVEGKASLGPLPLPQGSRLSLRVTKPGKLPYVAQLLLEDGKEGRLPALRDDPAWGLLAGLGSGHLPGLRLGASYHIPGGWLFLPLDAYLALSLPAAPEALPLYRAELRLGFGAYLFRGPEAALRGGFEAKGGAVLSGSLGKPAFVFLDPLVEPFAVFGEYALTKSLLLRLEVGGSFALGLGSLGVMSAGWLATPSLDLALEWKP